jgi:hypothetical protein
MTSYYSVLFVVITRGALMEKNVINFDEKNRRVINIVTLVIF